MKNIVFFSRCDLVNLYGQLSGHISKHHKIIHVAFSNNEYEILTQNYGIEGVINFKNELQVLLAKTKLDNLVCKQIDTLIINQTSGRFNLAGAIQSDRTFQFLSFDESRLLCQVYHEFWSNLILSHNVDYLVHEPTSLFLNHIAAIVCRDNNASYITQFIISGKNQYDFIVVSGDDCTFDELEDSKISILTPDNINEVEQFLSKFRGSYSGLAEEFNINSSFGLLLKNSIKSIAKSALLLLKNRNYTLLEHVDRYHHDSVDVFGTLQRLWGQYFALKYDDFDMEEEYYYYPMHLEPEAVVLYWGDGIYKEQVKLIENIAAQLPPNSYLYVKDHPHGGSYRDLSDYKKIKRIPNVKLLNPRVQGKLLIANSKAVLTINGTSGFEALLLNKQVFTFGNSFYESFSRVNKIANIKDLRKALYDNCDEIYVDDDELYQFVYKFLNSTHEGFVEYFGDYVGLAGIDEEKNSKIVSQGLLDYFGRSI